MREIVVCNNSRVGCPINSVLVSDFHLQKTKQQQKPDIIIQPLLRNVSYICCSLMFLKSSCALANFQTLWYLGLSTLVTRTSGKCYFFNTDYQTVRYIITKIIVKVRGKHISNFYFKG